MKLFVLPMLLGVASLQAAQAQNDVYVCTDENGAREYKNTGTTKGCKKLDLPGLSVAPPARRVADSKAATASAAGFPKVDNSTQKARDNDRKLILQDELRDEESKLASLRADFNNGEPERRGDERNYAKYQERVAGMKDNISRTERNIQALKRELSNVR
ncbi:DUF4124 domain-containing protein [Herbaspirillum sp. RV1423]|uniref:DUF4124 domain-containing protein n=1 Tax=Herbaspirillum sp. RV1423 TaxID=1443993 RepID=UPI00054EF40A|nr:hypothetical protein [Herbaspirillum sp. RV1423]